MKTYEEKLTPMPPKLQKFLKEIKCDLCGKTTKNEWKTEYYDAFESEIKMKTGDNYPDGGAGELVEIDICPDCFTSKLIPWVKEQGGEPTVTDWDW
jgi:hypothetical protein